MISVPKYFNQAFQIFGASKNIFFKSIKYVGFQSVPFPFSPFLYVFFKLYITTYHVEKGNTIAIS